MRRAVARATGQDDELRLAAETYVHDGGLNVIQPQWLTGDSNFGLIARDGHALVAVHVVIAQPGDSSSAP